jgi:myo-inositol-1(or 4)-monophosphatase
MSTSSSLAGTPAAAPADTAFAAHLLEVARGAALAVSEPLRTAFRSDMAVDYKVDLHDIVTVHDKRSEAVIRDHIFAAVPDSTLLGEEGGSVGSGRVHWYVDPIDGTSNFARGIAFWCVSIAAVVDGEIVAGVVYDPVADNMFTADLGGARLNGRPIRSSAVPDEREATLITGYPVSRDFRFDGQEPTLRDFATLVETFSTLRRPGSAALSLCHVAAGWTDATLGFSTNPWDVAAGILVLRQAGGTYEAMPMGRPASTPDHLCPAYMAWGAGADYPTLRRVATGIAARRAASLART